MTDHLSSGPLPPPSHESIQLMPPSSISNSQPSLRQNLDARIIYSVLKIADEQRQKVTRQPELQQFLSLIKADTEGKLITAGFQSDRVSLPIDSPAAFRSSSEPLPRPPSPKLTTSSSAESKKKAKKQKDKDTKDKTDKKRKKEKEKERDKEKSKKDRNRSSSSDGSGSDSDKPAKDEKKKKDKKRKKDSDESSNKKQRVSSPPEPVTDANALQAMEEGAVAARTATAELVSNAAVAQTKLAAVDNELMELTAATNAKLAQLSNSEEHRRMSEQAAIQAKERQATKETLEKIKKQMLQKEQVLSQLRTKREEIERQERAIMADKLKQSEYFLTLPTVHARFTWAANNQSLQTINPSMSSSNTSTNNSPSNSQSTMSTIITQPDDRIKLADENVLQLACLACQTHLRNFIDSMMAVKRKRLEEPIKQAIEHSKSLRVNQPSDDMVDTIRKIELKKELYWEKVAALREAKMKGVDPAEAERAFDLAHQAINQTSNQPSTLKKRGTEPRLLTVLDFAFALENDRLVNQSNAHTGRLASVHARLPHRIKEWPSEFQPPHPIVRTVNPIINRPANPYGASSPYGSSSYSVSQMSHQPIQNNQSNNPSPASTSHSDDLDALMDMDAGD